MRRARNEESKEHRKHMILECAEWLILNKGLSSLSIEQVAKRSKLAVGTIYLYFNSKEDIIAHLTIKSRQILLRRFMEATVSHDHTLDNIARVLETFYEFYKEKPVYTELVSFYESNSGLQETPELRQASDSISAFVKDLLKSGKERGHIRQDLDEETCSLWLWGTSVGIIQLIEVKGTTLFAQSGLTERRFYTAHIAQVIAALK